MNGLRVALFLAARSLARGSHGIAAATVLMMVLIYVSLLFLPSLIQGAVDRVDTALVQTVTSNIVITPASRGTSIGDAGAYLARIRRTAGVQAATAVYHVGIEVSHGTDTGSWSVDAIDPASFGMVFTTPSHVIDGGPLTERNTDQVLLGIGIAGSGETAVRGYRASLRDVYAGDQVTITFSGGRTAAFAVAGVYDDQFPQADNNAYITMYEADRLLPGIAGHATAIYVRTRPGADVNQVARRLVALRSGVKYLTSADLSATVADQVATFRLIAAILTVVSLLMAAVTIFTVTYVDLAHRHRQIGVERAIGIRSGPIVASYVLKALAYAAAGIVTGFLLFRFAAVPLVAARPFSFPNGPVALAVTRREMVRDLIVLAVVAGLAALVPALRSVRIPLLDAIWGE